MLRSHAECEQSLLCTVVEVALDLPAVRHRDVDRACLRLAQGVDLLLERLRLARAQQPARQRGVEPREAADDPRHERQ
jgi:hypothetical protein